MEVDPMSRLRTYASGDEWRDATLGDRPPTPDDCTILEDGSRIDSREKAIAYAEQMRLESIAGHARDNARD